MAYKLNQLKGIEVSQTSSLDSKPIIYGPGYGMSYFPCLHLFKELAEPRKQKEKTVKGWRRGMKKRVLGV